MLALNHIGKQIYWLQQLGDFALRLEYVKSENNKADPFTRPGLETSLSDIYFLRIWKKWGSMDWDLMATCANVNKTPQGIPRREAPRENTLCCKSIHERFLKKN